ncbi:hypothetical protein EVA_05174, partial [gut metagenome]
MNTVNIVRCANSKPFGVALAMRK